MDDAFAVGQRIGQRSMQGGFVGGRHIQAGHGQLNGVFLEAVNARKRRGGQKVAVHPQMGVAARAGCVQSLKARDASRSANYPRSHA